MLQQIIVYGSVAGAVALVAYILSSLLLGQTDARIRDRLANAGKEASNSPLNKASDGKGGISSLMQRVGQAAAQPFLPKSREKQSGQRKSLARAGVYAPNALRVLTGCKVLLLGGGLVGGYVAGMLLDQLMLGVSLGGLLGYIAPVFWLKSRIKSNQKALTLGLPDALDLMVVCVESGLTVDGAMQRVGQELALAHPALSRELGIAHMETRVGLSRSESLRNLGVRTGNAAIQSLASMLVQADRFGTSIAQALRVHAETLRNHRQQMAEEMAAKASVKMSFPLVLFIFPATFIVLAGPAVLGLMSSALFNE